MVQIMQLQSQMSNKTQTSRKLSPSLSLSEIHAYTYQSLVGMQLLVGPGWGNKILVAR